MNDQQFISEMRSYRIDHLPDGYPCIQTWQIDRLIEIIGRQALALSGKTQFDVVVETARRCADIAHNWRDKKTGISCCHRLGIEAEILEEFEPQAYPVVTCPKCSREYEAVGCRECPACMHEWDETESR
jgi:hypothetical protein